MSNEGIELEVYGYADPHRMIGTFRGAVGPQVLEEVKNVGGGSFRISSRDPQIIRHPEWLKSRNVVKHRVDGKIVGGWLIGNRDATTIGDDSAQESYVITGEGLKSWLDDARVDPLGGLRATSKDHRSFSFAAEEGDWYHPSEWIDPYPIDRVLDRLWQYGPNKWPDGATGAYWVWGTPNSNPSANVGTNYFRIKLPVTTAGTYAFYVAVDDNYSVYLDGAEVAKYEELTDGWKEAKKVTFDLDEGIHTIGVRATNHRGAAGLAAALYEVKPRVAPVTVRSVTIPIGTTPTLTAAGHGLTNGTRVYLTTTGTLPGGLEPNKDYWVNGVTANTLKLSNSKGGASINTSGSQSGTHTLVRSEIAEQEKLVTFSGMTVSALTSQLNAAQAVVNTRQATYNALPSGNSSGNNTQKTQAKNKANALALLNTAKQARDVVQTQLTAAQASVTAGITWKVLPYPTRAPGWTPGEILITLLEEAYGRGVESAGLLTPNFTSTHDSEGEPWDEPIDWTFSVGKDSLLSVVSKMEEMACDVWIDPDTYELNVVNRRGVDRSVYQYDTDGITVLSSPVIFKAGKNLRRATIKSKGKIKNSLAIKGEEGWFNDPEVDEVSVGEYGVIEGVLDTGASKAVSKTLASIIFVQRAQEEEGASYDVYLPPEGKTPHVDFGVGDWVLAPNEQNLSVKRRIMSISTEENSAGRPVYTIEFDTIFRDNEDRINRVLDKLGGGGVGSSYNNAGGVGSNSPSGPIIFPPTEGGDATVTIPQAPTDLEVFSIGYWSSNGVKAYGQVNLSWSPVVENTDGTEMIPSYYEVWGRPTESTEDAITMLVSVVQPMATIDSFEPGTDWTFFVYAWNNVRSSSRSAEITHTISGPVEPMVSPSKPTGFSDKGLLILVWDGLMANGEPPPMQFRYLYAQVRKAGTNNAWVQQGQTLARDGRQLQVTGLVIGDDYEARFIAVDGAGIKSQISPVSDPISITGIDLGDLNKQVTDAIEAAQDAADAAAGLATSAETAANIAKGLAEDASTTAGAASTAAANALIEAMAADDKATAAGTQASQAVADALTAKGVADQAQIDADAAAAEALAAVGIANSKGKVLTQTATPGAADRNSQTLWIDITGGANTPKRWNGTAWVAVTDKAATDAAAAAASAASAASAADAKAVAAKTAADNATAAASAAQGTANTALGNAATAQTAADAAQTAASSAQTTADNASARAAALVASAENKISNPSFELGRQGWELNPNYAVVESATARDGNRVLEFNSQGGYQPAQTEYMPSSIGRVWEAGIWMRRISGDVGAMMLSLRTPLLNDRSSVSTMITSLPVDEWVHRTTRWTATSDEPVRLKLQNSSTPLNGLIQFDLASLRDVTDAAKAEADAAVAQAAANAAQSAADAAQAAANAAQTAAGNAQTTADQAQATASGKSKTYRATTAPSGTGTAVEDTWEQWSSLGTNGKLLAFWRWSGSAWVKGTLDESYLPLVNIGAGTYGSLSGDRMSANSVSTEKLMVGSFDNLIPDPALVGAIPDYWRAVPYQSIDQWNKRTTTGLPGDVLQGEVNGNETRLVSRNSVAAKPGQKFALGARVFKENYVGTDPRLRMVFRDTAGGLISTAGIDLDVPTSTWRDYSVIFEVPNNPAITKVEYEIQIPAGATSGKLLVGKPTWREAVTGNVIVDGAITGTKIAGQTITGDKVVGGTIATNKLMVTSLDNLIDDGSFEYYTTEVPSWTLASGSTIGTDTPRTGSKVLEVVTKATPHVAATSVNAFQVEAGQQYRAEAWTRLVSGTVANAGLILRFTYGSSESSTYTSSADIALTPEDTTTSYTLLSGVWEVPANAKWARLVVVSREVIANKVYRLDDVGVYKMATGELIVDGGITASKIGAGEIVGRHIQAAAVDAEHVKAQAIAAEHIAVQAVRAEHIASDAVEANHIAAGSVKTSHISSEVGQELNIENNTSINLVVGQISEVQDSLENTNGSLEQMQTYYDFGPDGAIISSPGSVFATAIRNDSIEMLENGNVISYWNSGTLYVNQLVGERVTLGNHQLAKFEDGTVIRSLGA